jgi:hypothetical protein
MNLRDVQMVQGRKDFGFALKPGKAIRVSGHSRG